MAETFGPALRRYRDERGLTLRALAARSNISPSQLSELEHGKKVHKDYAEQMDRVLGADGELVAAANRQHAADLPEVDSERVSYALAHPVRVDTATVEALSATLAAERLLDDSVGADAVLPAVTVHVGLVRHLARESRGGLRTAVLDVGAQWMQFAGWLNTTTRRKDAARATYAAGLEWATETGTPDLLATMTSVLGHLAWTEQDYAAMVGMSAAAGRSTRASPAVLAVAAQQEARGHALLGDPEPTERLLDRADELTVAAVDNPDRIPPWLYFTSTGLLTMQRGLAYAYLTAAHPAYVGKAIHYLTAGLDELDTDTRESEWVSWYADQLERLHAGNSLQV